MKFSETVNEVIALAEAIQNYWDSELPKRHPDFPIVHPGEDSGPPPPEQKKLKDFLTSLSADDIYKLALIMHLGRGDFGTDDLERSYKALKEMFGSPDMAAAQMSEKAALAEDLTDGLDELETSGIDVDHLTFTTVHSGR